MKHSETLTPGQWRFVEQQGCVQGESSRYGISAPAPHHWVVPPLNINPDDVRVMAAAKDLLEALQRLLSRTVCDPMRKAGGGPNRTINTTLDDVGFARAAIAKATGET